MVRRRIKEGYTATVARISAVLITLNEEARVRDALESVAFCDEILVMDAGSTDRTREIAAAMGAHVVVNSPWPGFVAQRNLAVSIARNEWILALDADERITSPLRDEILSLAEHGFNRSGYRIPRVTWHLGRFIRGTDWYPDPQLRLFDRRKGRWRGGRIHESVLVDGAVGRLRHEIEHYPYSDISDHLRRIERYTTLWTAGAREAGRRSRLADLLVAPAWSFARNYAIRGGFKLGTAGLIISLLNAHYTFLKFAKLWEHARRHESEE
ncbi:MAG: glycosyltransferase family 2 protein [Vicinamibacteria bacterium]|nr:glycosyltransferase family 2 protein [Vicinamibacteria bacterium]